VVHLLHVVSFQQLHQQGVVVFPQAFLSKETIQNYLATVQRSVRTVEAWLSSGQVLYHFDKHTIREPRFE
jgi:Mlc titration factor MtfA (ptsG expression regulator)